MSVAADLGLSVHDPTRLVYVDEGTGPSVADSWDVATRLRRHLASVRELVLLAPLSFPYEELTEAHRAIPVTVVLPNEDVDDLVSLLGPPLLDHLGPGDRVLGSEPLLAALSSRGALGPAECTALTPDENPLSRLHELWRAERTVVQDASFGPLVSYREDLITAHVRDLGAHQRSDLAMLLATVRPGDTVVDAGAHVGAFSVPLARCCGPNGRVIAFEANPATIELLAENVRANELDWVELHHAAVSDRSGHPVTSSVADAGNTGAATASRSWSAESAGVTTITLDAWWDAAGRPAVDVIKLDVEGNELRALRGARDLLEANRPVVQLEVAADQLAANGAAPRDIFALLGQLGYRFHVNALERNRSDDRFELRPFDPADDLTKLVEDVLCMVDGDRLAT